LKQQSFGELAIQRVVGSNPNPRHQEKAKGSDNAPLQFLGPTTQMLNRAAQPDLEPYIQTLAQKLAQQMLAILISLIVL